MRRDETHRLTVTPEWLCQDESVRLVTCYAPGMARDSRCDTPQPGLPAAILSAAFELCAERSYERTSVEAIAARAGVGKQTIYRWWPSKGAVVMEALNEVVGVASDFPDSGDVVADLRQQMTAVSKLLSSPDFGPVYTGVIGAAQSDPAVAERWSATSSAAHGRLPQAA